MVLARFGESFEREENMQWLRQLNPVKQANTDTSVHFWFYKVWTWDSSGYNFLLETFNPCTKIYYSHYARTLFSIHIREILKEQAIKQNGIAIGLKFIISFVFAMMS